MVSFTLRFFREFTVKANLPTWVQLVSWM